MPTRPTPNTLYKEGFNCLRDGDYGIGYWCYLWIKSAISHGTNNVIFGVDNQAIAQIGWESGTLQAIATRQDTPTNEGILFGMQQRQYNLTNLLWIVRVMLILSGIRIITTLNKASYI